ncbi:MAG: YifB family Mg chelatase-like AAA ATPase, partial [Gammaproteobacteria bacterium]|nr:YifB family Mg chelatase-like AAA ATPase [Gammaproteobacteria bacterium]
MATLAVVYSRAMLGMQAPLVTVEAHLSFGMPHFSIVGMPETAVRESRDRVRSALMNSNYSFPDKRITVNLAPADLPKEGSRFDLPIALGILAASGQIPLEVLADYEFTGELALSGELRSVQGSLPFAIKTKQAGRRLLLPEANATEAILAGDILVYPAKHLLDVCAHLRGTQIISPQVAPILIESAASSMSIDLADVHGQHHAKRALEIAAAGGHSMLMTGPPGTGKTMLASRLPTILPDLSEDDALEIAAIRSISKRQAELLSNWRTRPFRSPHHTASSVALVGGGRPPCPGEISLAHGGVLFLDELPEFDRRVLESLREPLESGFVTISRAGMSAEFPARFQLIAAMNPCPCGHMGDIRQACRCSPTQIERYRSRLSSPLLDRIDLHVTVPALKEHDLLSPAKVVTETSEQVKQRVVSARVMQLKRTGKLNFQLSNS